MSDVIIELVNNQGLAGPGVTDVAVVAVLQQILVLDIEGNFIYDIDGNLVFASAGVSP